MDNLNRIFFFFQAEDGIRDGHVTGVQTCALPILAGGAPNAPWIGEAAIARLANAANTAAARGAAERNFGLVLLRSLTKTSVTLLAPSTLGFPRPPWSGRRRIWGSNVSARCRLIASTVSVVSVWNTAMGRLSATGRSQL